MEFGKRTLQLGEEIGKGSYGHVYRCTINEQEYAAKVISKDLIFEVLMELVILCSIRHPCLLSASFRPRTLNRKDLYVVMPLAVSDLWIYTRTNGGTIDQPFHTQWVSQLCQALYILHYYDLIHGDIKAKNVLVMSDNRIVLGDFTSSLMLCGQRRRFTHYSTTVTHRSLEEFMTRIMPSRYYWTGKPQDIWALGCTLVEMSFAGGSLVKFWGTAMEDGGDTETVTKTIKQLTLFLKADSDSATSTLFQDATTYSQDCTLDVEKFKMAELSAHGSFGEFLVAFFRLDPSKRHSANDLINHSFLRGHLLQPGQLMKVPNEALINMDTFGQSLPDSLDETLVRNIYSKIAHRVHYPERNKRRTALLIASLVTHTNIHDWTPQDRKYVILALDRIGMRLL